MQSVMGPRWLLDAHGFYERMNEQMSICYWAREREGKGYGGIILSLVWDGPGTFSN